MFGKLCQTCSVASTVWPPLLGTPPCMKPWATACCAMHCKRCVWRRWVSYPILRPRMAQVLTPSKTLGVWDDQIDRKPWHMAWNVHPVIGHVDASESVWLTDLPKKRSKKCDFQRGNGDKPMDVVWCRCAPNIFRQVPIFKHNCGFCNNWHNWRNMPKM